MEDCVTILKTASISEANVTNSFDGKSNISVSDERENLKLEENVRIIVCKKALAQQGSLFTRKLNLTAAVKD